MNSVIRLLGIVIIALAISLPLLAETTENSDSPASETEKPKKSAKKEISDADRPCGERIDLASQENNSSFIEAREIAEKYLEALDKKSWQRASTLEWSERDGGTDYYFGLMADWHRQKWKEFGKVDRERSLKSAYEYKSYFRLPDGQFYRFEYNLGMEKKEHLNESVVVGLSSKSGKWRVVSYYFN